MCQFLTLNIILMNFVSKYNFIFQKRFYKIFLLTE